MWLAAYPKSGNTWVRALLSAAYRGPGWGSEWLGLYQPGSLRTLHDGLGLAGARLSRQQLAPLRRLAVEQLPADEEGTVLCKVHDAFLPDADGHPLARVRGINRAIYVVRDPRDVAVSYAHHFAVDHATAVAVMAAGNDLGRSLAPGPSTGAGGGEVGVDVDAYADNYLLPFWSRHVTSWCDQDAMDVLVVRYEDLHRRPAETLAAMLDLLEVSRTPSQIADAVEAACFARLAFAEIIHPFAEAAAPDRVFFRRGVVGGWRDELDHDLARRIERDHHAVMARFGYPINPALPEGRTA